MRKPKLLAGAALILLAAATLVLTLRPEPPLQVMGELSKEDVIGIRKAVWRKTYPPIISDLSLRSLVGAPAMIARRFKRSTPIYKMEVRNHQFVAVYGRSAADAQARQYLFWCVFKHTNVWIAEVEYTLQEK